MQRSLTKTIDIGFLEKLVPQLRIECKAGNQYRHRIVSEKSIMIV